MLTVSGSGKLILAEARNSFRGGWLGGGGGRIGEEAGGGGGGGGERKGEEGGGRYRCWDRVAVKQHVPRETD